MSLILGIESTCDETGAAIVRGGRSVLSNVVATQTELHAKFRGVVPEIASRAHIENILPVIRESLERAGVTLREIDAVAVARRPGLIGSLLIGLTAAKTLAWALSKPLVAVDHVHAHLYSVMLGGGATERRGDEATKGPAEVEFPAVGLVVSGGHTALYELKSWLDVRLIGTTIDDAVGEAYDKVAAILGLTYPGGPVVDGLARQGDCSVIRFPRSMLGRESLDFSFSGLKTAVLYHVRGVPGKIRGKADEHRTSNIEHRTSKVEDVAAAFQEAAVDVLIRKLKRGIARVHAKSVIVGGGVSANSALRASLRGLGVSAFVPPLEYCTDNAAMTAGLGHLHFEHGELAGLDLDAITHSRFRDR